MSIDVHPLNNSPTPDRLSHQQITDLMHFTYEEFLPNGKFAWLYVPAYHYIPDLFFQTINQYLNQYEPMYYILWIKIQQCRQQANMLVQYCTDENFIIQQNAVPSPWHFITSKLNKDDAITPNILDHI
jgi:hypothetical protein